MSVEQELREDNARLAEELEGTRKLLMAIVSVQVGRQMPVYDKAIQNIRPTSKLLITQDGWNRRVVLEVVL